MKEQITPPAEDIGLYKTVGALLRKIVSTTAR